MPTIREAFPTPNEIESKASMGRFWRTIIMYGAGVATGWSWHSIYLALHG